MSQSLGYWGVPLAVLGGILRLSPPFLFVSLGECLTEKSGRINLGQEGTLVMGAMSAYGISYLSGSPWLGVLAAGAVGFILGGIHGWFCSRPKVNDIALGIAMMFLGEGLAFYLGRGLIQPQAAQLASINLGWWSQQPEIVAALKINILLPVGLALAILMWWAFRYTRWGMIVRLAGESSDASRAMGYSINTIRFLATSVGGFIAAIGGAFLSLYYPGSWNDNISSGQGLMAVALVIFARWNPINCIYAAIIFGGAKAIGPALQAAGYSSFTYLINATPYILTMVIMIITCSRTKAWVGAPAELGASLR